MKNDYMPERIWADFHILGEPDEYSFGEWHNDPNPLDRTGEEVEYIRADLTKQEELEGWIERLISQGNKMRRSRKGSYKEWGNLVKEYRIKSNSQNS